MSQHSTEAIKQALAKFFEDIGYEKWKAGAYAVVAQGDFRDDYHLGRANFEILHAAYTKAFPPPIRYVAPTQEMLRGAMDAEFRQHDGEMWRSGVLTAIAVDGDMRFFDKSSWAFYTECRVRK